MAVEFNGQCEDCGMKQVMPVGRDECICLFCPIGMVKPIGTVAETKQSDQESSDERS